MRLQSSHSAPGSLKESVSQYRSHSSTAVCMADVPAVFAPAVLAPPGLAPPVLAPAVLAPPVLVPAAAPPVAASASSRVTFPQAPLATRTNVAQSTRTIVEECTAICRQPPLLSDNYGLTEEPRESVLQVR